MAAPGQAPPPRTASRAPRRAARPRVRRAGARLPLAVLAGLVLTAAMLVPAFHALVRGAHAEARAFLYWSLVLSAGLAMLGLAGTRRRGARDEVRGQLLSLVGAYAVLPLLAALPLLDAVPDASLGRAWAEMVAAATTTGGSLFDPAALSETVHLWRAMVAWLGGLLVWIAAAAILAPLSLGGFEVLARDEDPRFGVATRLTPADKGTRARLARAIGTLAPVYAGLTGLLWLLLSAQGEGPTLAAIHAMSVISTSGITAGVPVHETAGIGGEAVVALFLLLAVTRRTFAGDLHRSRLRGLAEDREARMAAAIVGATTLLIFARHWLGAQEIGGTGTPRAAAGALWGTGFTALSFLTTTGFVSVEWSTARAWSGLDGPAIVLMGLALFGGGLATTAGGVKLLRVYALYAHGRREMDLLVHPHAAGGHGAGAGRLSRTGVEAAWIFFMLFALSLAGATLALAATGIGFDAALVLAVAALTTCGPLAEVSAVPAAALETLPGPALAIFSAGSVLGRLEALALIALFNPAFWRR